MTRFMADTTDHSAPTGYDLYAGYIDGSYRSFPFLKAQHPDKPTVSITVVGNPAAQVEDVETGDVTPAHAPIFVKAKGTTWYRLWVASYGVSHCPVPGAVAWQKIDHGPNGENIDISEVYVDAWPEDGIATIYCPASWAETVKSYCAQAGLTYIPATELPPVTPPAPHLLEEDMPTITIPSPDADCSPKDENSNAFEKGTVPCLAGTKGLVYVSTDPWPNTSAPGVRVAIGTGRPDATGNRDHWRVTGGAPPNATPVANFPIVLSYDATAPWTAGPHGDEQVSVTNYGPGEVTVTTQPTA